MNNLIKNYGKFTIKKRIDLAIAAMARHDMEEVATLGRTCPRKQYMATDEAYCGFIEQFHRIGICYNVHRDKFLREITAHKAVINLRRANFISYQRGISDAISDLSKDNPIWQKMDKKLDECLEKNKNSAEKIKHVRAKLKAVDEALKQFCNEIGADFINTRLWFSIGKAKDINSNIALDNQLIEEIKKDFYELWND